MRYATALLYLIIICTGCKTPGEKLHTVILSDGVSKSEAQIIGESYFAKHIVGGKLMDIHDGDDQWIIDGNIGGYIAKPVHFFIDKHSGKVTSQWGPSYDNPLEILP